MTDDFRFRVRFQIQSEIEDDGDGAVFPENSVGNRDISDESPSLEEEKESSSESEVDRCEFL